MPESMPFIFPQGSVHCMLECNTHNFFYSYTSEVCQPEKYNLISNEGMLQMLKYTEILYTIVSFNNFNNQNMQVI